MKVAELDEIEYWLIKYAFIDNRYVENTCQKLHISQATYFRKLPIAIIKLYYTYKFTK